MLAGSSWKQPREVLKVLHVDAEGEAGSDKPSRPLQAPAYHQRSAFAKLSCDNLFADKAGTTSLLNITC